MTQFTQFTRTSILIAVLGAAAPLFAASAAQAKPSEAEQAYQRERAVCMRGMSNQDRATCLREASAALREARKGNLSTGNLEKNSTQRCEALGAQDRSDCLARMSGAGTASGTARDGGIIREVTTPAAKP